MKKRLTAKEAALKWNLTERSVTGLCRSGKIPDVCKENGAWYIPYDAKKPADGRIHSGKYIVQKSKQQLPLPIGISDFRVASTRYYYVDKTMMIKDFLDEQPMVSLFTRPRRFGKTLNMDMLKVFFEHTDEDTSVYFRDRKIWKQGKYYRDYQGKYPVVFVSFKDVKCETWDDTLEKLAEVLSAEYSRHDDLLDSPFCKDTDKAYFRRVMERKASENELTSSFLVLTKMLHEHYRTAPVVIIDEYDTPIQQGHTLGFYDQVILFMRNLFSGGFKDNSHLSFGFMTGILRVAKESIFSGLNNLTINSILDEKYSLYFGFTEEEIQMMADYYGYTDRYEEIADWYDGYRFGNTDIFNPWSVINYFRNDGKPKPYWQATGSNQIIREVLSEADSDIYIKLQSLLSGGSFLTYIDTGVIYPEIRMNPSSVYSFLLVAGYLKTISCDSTFTDGYMCEVALPNKEILFVYKKEILDQLTGIIPPSQAIGIQEALYSGNAQALCTQIQELLTRSVSYYDTAGENFYHGLILGLCAVMADSYEITSNRESGEGRYDIQLMPKVNTLPGILIELKAAHGSTPENLKKLAVEALNQIKDRKYDTEMKSRGVFAITRFGIAFSGKKVEIVSD